MSLRNNVLLVPVYRYLFRCWLLPLVSVRLISFVLPASVGLVWIAVLLRLQFIIFFCCLLAAAPHWWTMMLPCWLHYVAVSWPWCVAYLYMVHPDGTWLPYILFRTWSSTIWHLVAHLYGPAHGCPTPRHGTWLPYTSLYISLSMSLAVHYHSISVPSFI